MNKASSFGNRPPAAKALLALPEPDGIMGLMKLSTLLLVCGLGFGCVLEAEELGPLLDKMAGAYGGRDRLEKLIAVRETGQVTAATKVGNSGMVVRTFARPLKLRIEIGDPAHPAEVRVLDGTNGWRNGKSVTGPACDAMVLQAARLDLPFQLLAHKPKLVEKEPIEYHGQRVRVVELPLENDLSMTCGIAPDSGRILFSSGQTTGGPMGRMKFETSYDDFRTVDGLLFAFKETNLAGGTKTADTTISTIQVLKTAPDDVFKP